MKVSTAEYLNLIDEYCLEKGGEKFTFSQFNESGMATLFLTKIIRWGESLGVMAPIALDNEPPRIGFFPAEACSFNYAASPEVSNPCSLSRVRFANLC